MSSLFITYMDFFPLSLFTLNFRVIIYLFMIYLLVYFPRKILGNLWIKFCQGGDNLEFFKKA